MLRKDVLLDTVYAYSLTGQPDTGRRGAQAIPVKILDLAYVPPGRIGGLAEDPLTGRPVTFVRGVILDSETLTATPSPNKTYPASRTPGVTGTIEPRHLWRTWTEHLAVLAARDAEATEVNTRLEVARRALRQRRATVVGLLDPADLALIAWVRQQEPEAPTDDPADVRVLCTMPLAMLEAMLRSAARRGAATR
jgi:hypothetical protein